MTYEVKIEVRPYTFHGSHHSSQETDRYAVCSCGWEKLLPSGWDKGEARRIIMIEHRLDHLEGRV